VPPQGANPTSDGLLDGTEDAGTAENVDGNMSDVSMQGEEEEADEDEGADEAEDEGADEAAGEGSESEEEDATPCAWEEVLGGRTCAGGHPDLQLFTIKFKDYSDPYKIQRDDLESQCINPPKVDRESLKWNKHIVGRELVVYWKAVGYVGWWGGKLTAYNPKTKKHKIEWDDGDRPWQEDLLNITKAKEWRFLLKGEKKEDIVQSMD